MTGAESPSERGRALFKAMGDRLTERFGTTNLVYADSYLDGKLIGGGWYYADTGKAAKELDSYKDGTEK